MEQTQTSQVEPVAQNGAAPEQTVPTKKGNSQDNLLGVVSYIGPLFLLTMVARPKNKFCMFHARQSMVLFAITFFVMMTLAIIPFLGSLLTLPLFGLYVFAIYKAYSGELWAIPGINQVSNMIDVEKLFGSAGVSMKGISGMVESVAQQREESGVQAPEVKPAASTPTPVVEKSVENPK